MNQKEPLAFVERHGIVLQAARGPLPNLAEAIAGGTTGQLVGPFRNGARDFGDDRPRAGNRISRSLWRVGSGTPLRHGRGRWRVWIGNTDAAPREKSGFEAALSYTVAH